MARPKAPGLSTVAAGVADTRGRVARGRNSYFRLSQVEGGEREGSLKKNFRYLRTVIWDHHLEVRAQKI